MNTDQSAMTRSLVFVGQLLLLSALLSVALKYGGPYLPALPPTLPLLLLMIGAPALAVATILFWLQMREKQDRSGSKPPSPQPPTQEHPGSAD